MLVAPCFSVAVLILVLPDQVKFYWELGDWKFSLTYKMDIKTIELCWEIVLNVVLLDWSSAFTKFKLLLLFVQIYGVRSTWSLKYRYFVVSSCQSLDLIELGWSDDGYAMFVGNCFWANLQQLVTKMSITNLLVQLIKYRGLQVIVSYEAQYYTPSVSEFHS